ncbi:DUF2735 domain-containing protein [Mesorhizobium yinganensis]|uniref:DUF2735 domain-containing protein n=1 Tax=Mesorhizobium yinganensis TaxID=3157707 RepID=UPI0032B7345E
MTTTSPRETAKIFTFPTKGGRAVASPKASQPNSARVVIMPRAVSLAFDAWYHQAAVQEERDAKR